LEIRNQTVKDPPFFFFGTRQSPTSVIYLTKIGSTVSPEEHQPLERNRSAYREIKSI
jgi:hypothetical protein